MDKPTEGRSLKLGDKKKSKQNPHLCEEQLLQALDGELSASDALQVEVHVASCWSCRARREQIEKAIGDVVEYRDHLVQPYFPLPIAGRSMFVTRLEQLAASIGRPPLWKRILRAPRIFGMYSQIEVRNY